MAAVLTDWRAVSPIRAGRTGLSSRPPRGDTRDPSRDTTEEWRYTYRESGERRERERGELWARVKCRQTHHHGEGINL